MPKAGNADLPALEKHAGPQAAHQSTPQVDMLVPFSQQHRVLCCWDHLKSHRESWSKTSGSHFDALDAGAHVPRKRYPGPQALDVEVV